MKLDDYINKHYNGNKRQFALDNAMTAQQVNTMLRKAVYHVHGGYLGSLKRKVKIHETTGETK